MAAYSNESVMDTEKEPPGSDDSDLSSVLSLVQQRPRTKG